MSRLSRNEILRMLEAGTIHATDAFQLIKSLPSDGHPASTNTRNTPGTICFTTAWHISEVPAKAASLAGSLLIFDKNEALRDALQAQLQASEQTKASESAVRLILVTPGESYQACGTDQYIINTSDPADYQHLLQALHEQDAKPEQIVYAWGHEAFSTDEQAVQTGLTESVYSLLYLTQALTKQKWADQLRLLYVYPGGRDQVQPLYTALSGFHKTMQMENPKLFYQTLAVSDRRDVHQVGRAILRELSGKEEGATDVCYESEKRYVRRLQEVVVPSHPSSQAPSAPDTNPIGSFPTQGVCLITGGAGGLGLIFARYLAQQAKAKLVLTGRSELSADKTEQIRQLEANGAEVLYLRGDVSNREDVQRWVAETKACFGTINGIIHSAGLLRDSLAFTKTKAQLDDVLAPKVYGTLWLDEATKGEALDFFVLFSSTAAMIGNAGQCDYAYANGFMDAFAAYRSAIRPGKSVSINWPIWRDGGMQVPEAAIAQLTQATGIVALSEEAGVQAFADALQGDATHLMVLEGDQTRIRTALKVKAVEQPQSPATAAPHTVHTSAIPVTDQLRDATEDWLKSILSNEINLPAGKISSKQRFEKYGIDSIIIMSITKELEKSFGELPKTLFYEYQTIGELTGYFIENYGELLRKTLGVTETATDLVATYETAEALNETTMRTATSPTKSTAYRAPQQNNGSSAQRPGSSTRPEGRAARTRNRFARSSSDITQQPANSCNPHNTLQEIAIIGIDGRFPQSNSLNEYWENLKAGKDCVTEIPADRWDYRQDFDPEKGKAGKAYGKWGGFLDGVDQFDPLFFEISPREAEYMDPQERLFLETVWHAVEDAGYTPAGLSKQSVGVFVGVMYAQYQMFGAEPHNRAQGIIPGNSLASIANRVSYFFDFQGPSLAMDTMCSSSLTTVHLACESIRRGECEIAIAGGVNVSIHPNKFITLSQGGLMSSDGKCHSFADGGDGYVPGEGVGAVLLKPLQQAIADGDHIYGVIKGSALNHSGRSNGYMVPNLNTQARVIEQTLKQTGINPRTISYIECQAVGTSLGDPIEVNSMTKAYRPFTMDIQYCPVGSVKANIGHLESASGIAAIAKVLLQLKHKQIAPSIHSEVLNPNIAFEETPFYVNRELSEWKQPVLIENGVATTYPRRAAINAFGAGGANAHMIIEEYQAPEATCSGAKEEDSAPQLIILSARTKERLQAYADQLATDLQARLDPVSGENTDLAAEGSISTDSADTPSTDSGNLATIPSLLERDILQLTAQLLTIAAHDLDLDEMLAEYGLDAVGSVELTNQLNAMYGIDLVPNVFAECPTLRQFLHDLTRVHADQLVRYYADAVHSPAVAIGAERVSKPLRLSDIAYTLQTGREAMEERLAFMASTIEEAIQTLRAYQTGKPTAGTYVTTNETDSMFDGRAGEVFIRQLIESQEWNMLGKVWASGAEVDWNSLPRTGQVKRIPLSTYPFARKRYWAPLPAPEQPVQNARLEAAATLEVAPTIGSPADTQTPPAPPLTWQERVQQSITQLISDLLKLPVEEIKVKENLKRYGFDSLSGMRLMQYLEKEYNTRLSIKAFADLSSIHDIVNYICHDLFNGVEPASLTTNSQSQSGTQQAGNTSADSQQQDEAAADFYQLLLQQLSEGKLTPEEAILMEQSILDKK
ncbi:SDR family NAD(P)-dependent oxidoreductase [Brevibacillus dissolubilis]|uniref:SDR family NAD(P)-dependent oxidoreductase n=1 Tax=Brevibacillus dissolubilis TaxID=1844116 RepID=UPI0011166FE7|nr:SDR family NAD(P)-dependent oxidoreductase [Brevibacillus dissolubilis]